MGLMLKGSYAEDGACHLHGAKKDAPASDQQRMRRETQGLFELSLRFPAQCGHSPSLSAAVCPGCNWVCAKSNWLTAKPVGQEGRDLVREGPKKRSDFLGFHSVSMTCQRFGRVSLREIVSPCFTFVSSSSTRKIRKISEPVPILPGLVHCLKTTLKFAARSLSYSLDSNAIKVH